MQRTILFYLTRTAYHALLHTKHAAKPYNKRHPVQGAFWARSMGSARQTGHTPHGRTSATPSPQRMKILTRKYLLGRVAHECRGQYCFISLAQHTMHYFTQNTLPNPTTKGTLYRVPSGQDPWVWPDNPAYPPWPHLQKLHTEGQRKILFYLPYNNNTFPINLSERDSNDPKTTR